MYLHIFKFITLIYLFALICISIDLISNMQVFIYEERSLAVLSLKDASVLSLIKKMDNVTFNNKIASVVSAYLLVELSSVSLCQIIWFVKFLLFVVSLISLKKSISYTILNLNLIFLKNVSNELSFYEILHKYCIIFSLTQT